MKCVILILTISQNLFAGALNICPESLIDPEKEFLHNFTSFIKVLENGTLKNVINPGINIFHLNDDEKLINFYLQNKEDNRIILNLLDKALKKLHEEDDEDEYLSEIIDVKESVSEIESPSGCKYNIVLELDDEKIKKTLYLLPENGSSTQAFIKIINFNKNYDLSNIDFDNYIKNAVNKKIYQGIIDKNLSDEAGLKKPSTWVTYYVKSQIKQGWKLHLGLDNKDSAKSLNILKIVTEYLQNNSIPHKIISSFLNVIKMHKGFFKYPGGIQLGKEITIYPINSDNAAKVAQDIDDLLVKNDFKEQDFIIHAPNEPRLGKLGALTTRYGSHTTEERMKIRKFNEKEELTDEWVEDDRTKWKPDWITTDPFTKAGSLFDKTKL